MKYLVKIYQSENSDMDEEGISRLFHTDKLLTMKEIFEYIMEGLDISDKYYIMEVTETAETGYELYSIFSIKVNVMGNIEEIKVKS